MTRMTPLLQRNEKFARTYTPVALGLPTAQLLVVTCLDHRVDPAIVLGLQLGEAPVIRNAGGRVTQAVIDDLAYLAFLTEQLPGARDADGMLFEVAVVHHTQCGTGFLANPGFRHQAAEATGLSEAALEASAVADPHVTVRADVERLLSSPLLSPKLSVRPRVRHRYRTRHHHARRPVPTAASFLSSPGVRQMNVSDKARLHRQPAASSLSRAVSRCGTWRRAPTSRFAARCPGPAPPNSAT